MCMAECGDPDCIYDVLRIARTRQRREAAPAMTPRAILANVGRFTEAFERDMVVAGFSDKEQVQHWRMLAFQAERTIEEYAEADLEPLPDLPSYQVPDDPHRACHEALVTGAALAGYAKSKEVEPFHAYVMKAGARLLLYFIKEFEKRKGVEP